MKIGLTYDLRDDWIALGVDEEHAAEFDSRATIEALREGIASLGHEVDAIGNLHRLLPRLIVGDRWDLVFNIAEGRLGFGREAQVPAMLDAFGIAYTFADPLTCCTTLHKATAKHVLRDLGIPTPRSWVLERIEQLDEFVLPPADVQLFAKPIAEGTSKGIAADARVRDRAALRPLCERLLARYEQPVLIEEFLPGAEVTVGILGTGDRARIAGVLAVELGANADQDVYTYRNKEECESLVHYRLADAATTAAVTPTALAAWRALGGRDGGRVDLRADADGVYQVLELNPLPGMHPSHSDLPILCGLAGMSYRELLEQIIASAMQRVTVDADRDGVGAACTP